MKILIVLYSYHHRNTEKIALSMAGVLGAQIKTPSQVKAENLTGSDLLGFGSGIYSSQHHPSLLSLAESFPPGKGKGAFLFSTCGVPAFAFSGGGENDYIVKSHSPLREALQYKGYRIIDEFACVGYNTNSFLKFFGGINKGRPNKEDLHRAEEFARNLQFGGVEN